ncbi:WD40/YVTN/BNR-like repeat-containing protein [Synoicihabitans lomoniglobus]|uniref:Glycosyl hydrolase n=1 Tax=Synoicihabitans lomoniglobus TaxID=2909285 RepID=A0AAF0CPG0_9BACT|nr:hypothetical protein [Opitutaceae bacterium LMO-M01]WED64549.1 hypothetical protein PXH66_19585 [Opitutaceae bacterium LMO-M01]
MNLSILLRYAIGLLTVGTTFATTSEPHLFVAAAFTKAQRNSSIPTDAGIFVRMPDTGWTSFGPKIQAVNSAAVDPSDTDRIFLSCGNGIVRSLDGGATWRMVTGWQISDVYGIVIDPTDGNTLYAATGWGPWCSTDGGDTWTFVENGLAERFNRTIAMDPLNPQRLFLGTSAGLHVTTNGAKSWKREKDIPAVNILRVRHGVSAPKVWLTGTEGRGAWLSTNGGKSWQPTAPAAEAANVYAVAVDPTDGQRLAIGGWDIGVLLSTDGGKTWQNRAAGLPSANVLTLVFDPTHSGRLWAGTFEEGAVFTEDNGATWHDGGIDGSLPNDMGFLLLSARE